jgi:DNA (cytosine-5)-methyltransferase 1
MNYGSVCSGVEAASLAWKPLGWTAKFYAEVEPFPSAVLCERFGATRPLRSLDPAEAQNEKDRKLRESWKKQIAELPPGGRIPNLGDFPKIKETDYDGHIDLLVGGCPCQSYSLAGLRKGLADPRGNLTLEFVKLAYRTKARIVVFENVPGILSSGDCGSDFAGFLSLLCGWEVKPPKDGWRKCGIVTNAPGCFGVAWRILDAQYTRVPEFPRAVPQRRRRLILVGHLDSWLYPAKVLFDGEMRGGDTPPGRTKRQGLASGAESGIDSAKSIRMRCGKPGGGKGALIGDNLSHTLATGNDQTIICLPKEQECFDIRQVEIHEKEIAPTLIATDYKGGKAISFYPQRKAESMIPLEECSNTLVNGTCPGHQNAVCFENHGNDSRIKESPGVSPTITSRAGTGGGNLPLVMRDEEPIGFIKNDAGGEQQGYWTGAFPTIRSQVIPAVAIAENVIGRQVENGGNGIGAKEEVAYTQNCTGVMGVCQNATVRRLLPVECERLMGFPDNHTRIPWKGKPEDECPDAPRYKACGNSMCVNVMAWIGQRIQHMEDISVRSSGFSEKE